MLLRVITAVVVIAGLRLGKDVVIPLTLAILVSFLLAHPINWLEKLKLGKVAPVVLVLLFSFTAGGTMIWIGAQQLADILIRLPDYQQNIEKKLERVKNPAGSVFARAAQSVEQIATELSKNAMKPLPGAQTNVMNEPGGAPVPVRVVKSQPSVFDSFGFVGGSLAHFFVMAGAVAILTLFILLRRSDLRNRLFRLFGQGRISVMTTAMDDAAKRVSRYLLTQSLVNCGFGSLLALGLYIVGLPYAAFWGVLGAALRFIPYLGTLTAGLCPFLLSLAVFEGWKKPLLVLGLFALVEMSISGIVEPLVYSTRTGISSVAILCSAAFWTMLWGPIGLVVSTPLTVLFFVLGRHIPQLEFLYVLLGDEPVLSPHAHYYQRLLALDEDEAREVVEDYLKEHTALELYDSVLVPALSLAEQDRHENQLDEERQKAISDTTRELIEEVGEDESLPTETVPFTVAGADQISVLCVPARDEADELVASMAAQVLAKAGFRVEVLEAGFMEQVLAKVEQARPDVVLISALPPFAINHARSLCRRTRARCRGVKTVIGLWVSTTDTKLLQQRLGSGCSEYVVHTLQEARLQLRLFMEELRGANVEAAPEEEHLSEPGEPLTEGVEQLRS